MATAKTIRPAHGGSMLYVAHGKAIGVVAGQLAWVAKA